jgi:hypothetical protein
VTKEQYECEACYEAGVKDGVRMVLRLLKVDKLWEDSDGVKLLPRIRREVAKLLKEVKP